jgi:HSP20 family protein
MNVISASRTGLLDEFLRDIAGPAFFVRPLHGEALPANIKIDLIEDAEGYTLHAELPGVTKQDIHVDIDGPVVSLKAEVKQVDRQTEAERVLRAERYVGAVSRSLQLPVDIDRDAAQARYDNGVLTLTLPKKRPDTSSKRITIN